MRHTPVLALLVGVGLFGVSARAHAQVGDEGKITTRSDVKMSVEGAPGTFGKKLDAFAQVLGAPLADVKKCYGDLVKQHPETVGELAVSIDVPEKGNAKITAPGAVKELKPMQRCVDRAFAKLDVSQVPRPAGVRLSLALTNSAAASVQEVRQQGNAASKVALSRGDGGLVEASGESLGHEVRYVVRAKGGSVDALVEHAATELRSALPGLFDCRRRASKLGSPEGDITLKLKLTNGARASVDTVSSTVSNERAPICVSSVLKRNFKPGAQGAVDLIVHFSPPAPSDAD